MPKTLLIFRGPAHHAQLLRPIEDALEQQGWKVIRYTVDTEAFFQVGLNKELGLEGYLWLPDYYNEKEAVQLYRQHTEYFHRLFLQPNPLSLTTPQVLDRIVLFCCREWVATRTLIQSVRPDRCLALHELNRWSMMLGYFSARRHIPFYTLQEGLYYGNAWLYTGHTRYSHSLVWGEATKRKLLTAGCDPERVRVLGHPDLKRHWNRGEPVAALSTLPKEKKLGLLFFTNTSLIGASTTLFAGLAESEWVIAVRYHQLASMPQIEKLRDMFKRPGCFLFDNSSADNFALHWELIRRAQVLVIVGCSTTAVEWAWSGKPQGQIRTATMHRDFATEGLAVDCDNMPLVEAFNKTVREWNSDYQERTAKFVAEEIATGDAAGVIADVIAAG